MLCRTLCNQKVWIGLAVLLILSMALGGCRPVQRLPAAAAGPALTGSVHEVFPTGDAAQDIAQCAGCH